MSRELKMLNARRPQFFKVFLPDVSSQQLSIPLGFVEHMKRKTSGTVFLTGPSGNTWQVNMIQSDNRLFFHEGWSTFVNDHSTELGDFIIFRYDGNSHFTVTIFDKTACEKRAAFDAKSSQRKKRTRVQATASSSETSGNALKRRGMDSWSKARHKQDVTMSKTKKEDTDQPVSKLDSHAGRCLPVQPDIDGQSASKALASRCPFFVTCLKRSSISRPRTLYIPAWFVKRHLPGYGEQQEIIVQNSKGDDWLVNFVRRPSGARLSAGWASFVHNNQLRKGQTYMFELAGEFKMRVHDCGKNRELH